MLVAAATWPVIEHLNTAVIGRGTDAFVHLWLFHWIEDTLREGSVSFFTDQLFYPTGVSLLNQTIAWLNAALWLLVKPLVGAIPAYSLLVLGLMVFNGFALFLFVHDLTHIWEASVVAGTVALLWPALLDHSYQISLLPIGFVVMALRSLRRLLDQGRASDMKKLGIWLGLIGMLRFQMLIFGAFLWGFYAIVRLARMDFHTVWQRVRLIGGSGGIGALLSAPFTLPYLLYHFRVRGPGSGPPVFKRTHLRSRLLLSSPARASYLSKSDGNCHSPLRLEIGPELSCFGVGYLGFGSHCVGLLCASGAAVGRAGGAVADSGIGSAPAYPRRGD